MEEEIKVENKIISIEVITKVATYLQELCKKYTNLMEEDKAKNEVLEYKDRNLQYDGSIPHIKYTVELQNGKNMTEQDYEWFATMLEDTKNIKCIAFELNISYTAGDYFNGGIHKNLSIHMDFYDNRIYIRMFSTELRDELQQIYSDIRAILDSCPIRYDNTIKRRSLRMNTFYFSVGLIFAYIAIIALFANIDKIPEQLVSFTQNKYIISALHMAIAIIIGKVFGSLYMNKLYKDILPEKKYSHYSESSQKSVYVDNVVEYTEHNEVQIGNFHDSIKRRNTIESIYKIAKLITLAQLVVYALYIFL